MLIDSKILETYKNQLEYDKNKKRCELFEKNLVGALNSASYKLGHLLLHETRSLYDIFALPFRILRIRKDSNASKSNVKKITANTSLLDKARNNRKTKVQKFEDLKTLKFACIMDTFTYSYFSYEAQFFQLSAASWQSEIEELKPCFLFVESAWRGKNNQWVDKVEFLSQELVDILLYCEQHSILTIFWNKEDPVYFENFINTAKYFDYIFTSDSGSISKYKKIAEHNNVYLLPFGCQPKIHNPIKKYTRKNAVVFAGSYYHRYEKRNEALESFMVNLIPKIPIDIYDREHLNENTSHKFPSAYAPFIRGHLEYHEIDKANKGYKYAINLNSITDSPTMFARRVFELAACNTTIFSNYAKGVKTLFGDLITVTDDGAEIADKLDYFSNHELTEKKLRLLALRKVMTEHTAEIRLHTILSHIVPDAPEMYPPSITVMGYANSLTDIAKLIDSFERQTYQNKNLLIVSENKIKGSELPKGVSVIFTEDYSSHSIAKTALECNYLAGMATEDYYGENYLTDLVLATKYDDFTAIGKAAYYEFGDESEFVLKNESTVYHRVQQLPVRSSIVKLEKIAHHNAVSFVKAIATLQLEDENCFSIDEFNYCKNPTAYDLPQNVIDTVSDLKNINTGQALNILYHA